MDSFLKIKWLRGEAAQVQLWQRAPQTWQPPINAFRCETCVRICMDLAGVEKSAIDLQVESFRVIVRGQRQPPEPDDRRGRVVQVLALEIDYGPFERELRLPAEVDAESAHAVQENGLLWICLPLKQ